MEPADSIDPLDPLAPLPSLPLPAEPVATPPFPGAGVGGQGIWAGASGAAGAGLAMAPAAPVGMMGGVMGTVAAAGAGKQRAALAACFVGEEDGRTESWRTGWAAGTRVVQLHPSTCTFGRIAHLAGDNGWYMLLLQLVFFVVFLPFWFLFMHNARGRLLPGFASPPPFHGSPLPCACLYSVSSLHRTLTVDLCVSYFPAILSSLFLCAFLSHVFVSLLLLYHPFEVYFVWFLLTFVFSIGFVI